VRDRPRISDCKLTRAAICFAVLLTFALRANCGPVPPPAQAPSQQATTYSQDSYGLEKEFEPFLTASATSASDDELVTTLKILAIPNATEWFGSHFPSDKAEQLASDQQAAIDKLQRNLATSLRMWPEGTHFQLSCEKFTAQTAMQPRPDAIFPTADVAVEPYQMTFIPNYTSSFVGKLFGQLSNFVYIDGAYRYVGGGAYPFWSMPVLNIGPTAASLSARSVQASYDDSPGGLKRLMQDALKLAKQNDQAKLDALTASMEIPNALAWFTQVFGPVSGSRYVDQYVAVRRRSPNPVRQSIEDFLKQQFTSVDVTRFTDACAPDGNENDYPLLLTRVEPQPISKVTFSHADGYVELAYFAYIDGGFRFLGNLQASPAPPPLSGPVVTSSSGATASSAAVPLQEPEQITAGHLIKRVPPVYPDDARQHIIQGSVTLRVRISTDGVPSHIQVLKGVCSLANASIDALQQWRYAPTLVNGEPVEVETNVVENFKLSR
jgi:TonB family protein